MELLITDHLTFSDEHKKLLAAQVVLTDRLDKLAAFMQESREAQREALKATDERLNALIAIVDGLIRNRPNL